LIPAGGSKKILMMQIFRIFYFPALDKAIFENGSNGKVEVIDLNTKNDPCGLFVFNGQKPPLLVDMTNIDTDLGFYFSK